MIFQVSPREVELSGISRSQVIDFAKSQSWHEIEHPQRQLLVLEGPPDDEGEPLLMVLPRQDGSRTLPIRLAEAINQIAGVEDRSPYDVLREIQALYLSPLPSPEQWIKE